MTLNHRILFACGAVALLLAVMLGAYGAHGMQGSPSAGAYQTAVEYQFFHGLGLILVTLLEQRFPASTLINASAWLLLAGIILFCGSIFATSLGAPAFLGSLAPVGGSAFMLGWLSLGIGVLRA